MFSQAKIAKHYLRSWFFPDLIASIPYGWIYAAATGGEPQSAPGESQA